ncbi:hypothetical protein M885DRAFT_577620 [Pelagophyceae sp. CCMP2097]|nr:hypothetical protein M885DRAFT_577620 [Pelagophyceae sp. CCMP2097]
MGSAVDFSADVAQALRAAGLDGDDASVAIALAAAEKALPEGALRASLRTSAAAWERRVDEELLLADTQGGAPPASAGAHDANPTPDHVAVRIAHLASGGADDVAGAATLDALVLSAKCCVALLKQLPPRFGASSKALHAALHDYVALWLCRQQLAAAQKHARADGAWGFGFVVGALAAFDAELAIGAMRFSGLASDCAHVADFAAGLDLAAADRGAALKTVARVVRFDANPELAAHAARDARAFASLALVVQTARTWAAEATDAAQDARLLELALSSVVPPKAETAAKRARVAA